MIRMINDKKPYSASKLPARIIGKYKAILAKQKQGSSLKPKRVELLQSNALNYTQQEWNMLNTQPNFPNDNDDDKSNDGNLVIDEEVTTDEENSQFHIFSQQTSTPPMITESDLNVLPNLEIMQEKQNNASEFEGFIQLREALIENHPTQVKQEEEERE